MSEQRSTLTLIDMGPQTPGTDGATVGSNFEAIEAWSATVGGGPGGASEIVTVTVTTSSYTLVTANVGRIYVFFNGAVTITLAPGMMVNGQEIVIMERGGYSSAVITVLPGGSATIDGQPSGLINTAYGRLRLIFDGTNYGVA
jgi:hypothetical protein